MSDRSCVRCKRELPASAFDRTALGAFTDGGMPAWCNECYVDPYWSELGKLDSRPMRHVSQIDAIKPWSGWRDRKAAEGEGQR